MPFSKTFSLENQIKIFPLKGSAILVEGSHVSMITPPTLTSNILTRSDVFFSTYLFRGRAYQEKIQALRQCENTEAHYHFYLAGFVTYLKAENYSLSRKFSGKLRRLQPDSKEPLNWLKLSGASEVERRYVEHQFSPAVVAPALSGVRPRKRLYLGEGNFTYVQGIVKKYKEKIPGLAKAITATELQKKEDLVKQDKSIAITLQELEKEGVTTQFDVDATQIHETYKRRRFERIQWNGAYVETPQGEKSIKEKKEADRSTLRHLIRETFSSASALQLAGDRVQLAMQQEKTDDRYDRTRQAHHFDLVRAATEANYRLVAKRRMSKERNPDFKPKINYISSSYDKPENMREFVFEKLDEPTVKRIRKSFKKTEIPPEAEKDKADLSEDALSVGSLAQKYMDPRKKEYVVHSEGYYECSTDDESSDYVTEDESFRK